MLNHTDPIEQIYPWDRYGISKHDVVNEDGPSTLVMVVYCSIPIMITICFALPFLVASIIRPRVQIRDALTASVNAVTVALMKLSREDRYQAIEKSLVSRRVEAHDEICGRIRANQTRENLDVETANTGEKHPSSRGTSVVTDEESDDHSRSDSHSATSNGRPECPICYELFEVKDIVSWSPNATCGHVFHHRCIKEWLLKNNDCPYCRAPFLTELNIDQHERDSDDEQQIHHEPQQQERCFYCVDHGIVRFPGEMVLSTTTSSSIEDGQAYSDEILIRVQSVPNATELKELRGSIHVTDDDEQQHNEATDNDGADTNQAERVITSDTPSIDRV